MWRAPPIWKSGRESTEISSTFWVSTKIAFFLPGSRVEWGLVGRVDAIYLVKA